MPHPQQTKDIASSAIHLLWHGWWRRG